MFTTNNTFHVLLEQRYGNNFSEKELSDIQAITIFSIQNDSEDRRSYLIIEDSTGTHRVETEKELRSFDELLSMTTLKSITISIITDDPDNLDISHDDIINDLILTMSKVKSLEEIQFDYIYSANYSPLEQLPNLQTMRFKINWSNGFDYKYLNTLPAEGVKMYLDTPVFQTIEQLNQLPNPNNIYSVKVANPSPEMYQKLTEFTNLENLELHTISTLDGYLTIPSLTQLSLEGDFSDLSPITKQTNLTKLSIQTCSTTDLSLQPLANMQQMKKLQINAEFMSSLDGLEHMSELTYFYGRESLTEDISALRYLYELSYVNLEDNLIQDISALSNHFKLTHLYLRMNEITDLTPLNSCNNLAFLNVEGNPLSDLTPIHGKLHLKVVYVSMTKACTWKQLEPLIRSLPELEILSFVFRDELADRETLVEQVKQTFPELVIGRLEDFQESGGSYEWKKTPPVDEKITF